MTDRDMVDGSMVDIDNGAVSFRQSALNTSRGTLDADVCVVGPATPGCGQPTPWPRAATLVMTEQGGDRR
ncbi:MAG: hypothetical protein M3137_09135 [Actinomycetota bacterium]|nr:hypothetical protein [Actinomycetota bacterium]